MVSAATPRVSNHEAAMGDQDSTKPEHVSGALLPPRLPEGISRPKSLEFAAGPWSQTGQFAAWRASPGNAPTRQILTDGPQVFRSLSVGARVPPRLVGAQSCGVFG